MLKSIIWYLVIGGMAWSLEIFTIAAYALCKYKFDSKKAHEWVGVFSNIHEYPWIDFGKRIGLSMKSINLLEGIVFITTWPYAISVAIYSAVLATREFEQRLKEES